jgi:hypothetical protein
VEENENDIIGFFALSDLIRVHTAAGTQNGYASQIGTRKFSGVQGGVLN